ncbi:MULTISPECIES: homoprotocatechuate degradation operon regulator HpaR [unclassified Bradyrhizobium]|uniref:homoprotocatechuate degradation operon regulator HpaR n=1 Tax=unclassified Bradyrhizobium TaxID=2631580 RepID=UPI00201269CF|nr:homoprotocatechuate degradation operon regulator HpaR [Bradyrhizobium sp. U87765 SZCCT0134]
MLLLRAREAVMRQFRPMLREHGVTEQQWRVLRALHAAPATEITELARATFLRAPSLSRILRDLEPRGLVVRRADVHDHRRVRVTLGAAGVTLIDQISPRSEAIYRDIARRLGGEKFDRLQDLLRELEAEMLRDAPPEIDDETS